MENDRFTVDERAVVYERYDEEVIAINLNTGIYYSMNATAAEIFELVAADSSIREVVAALGERYAEDAARLEQETRRFLADLRKEALVETATADRPKADARQVPDRSPQPFIPPRLDKHSDMQELFLLDPIHETGTEGWPHPREAQT